MGANLHHHLMSVKISCLVTAFLHIEGLQLHVEWEWKIHCNFLTQESRPDVLKKKKGFESLKFYFR